MPQFAVFFSDDAGYGFEMVQALDAAHAPDIARAQHPKGRLSEVPAELLDGQDHHQMLMHGLVRRSELGTAAAFSPASESRPTTAVPQAPSPRPTLQGSGAALGSLVQLTRSLSRTPTRAAASSQ